jgi:hypothetical protein
MMTKSKDLHGAAKAEPLKNTGKAAFFSNLQKWCAF